MHLSHIYTASFYFLTLRILVWSLFHSKWPVAACTLTLLWIFVSPTLRLHFPHKENIFVQRKNHRKKVVFFLLMKVLKDLFFSKILTNNKSTCLLVKLSEVKIKRRSIKNFPVIEVSFASSKLKWQCERTQLPDACLKKYICLYRCFEITN